MGAVNWQLWLRSCSKSVENKKKRLYFANGRILNASWQTHWERSESSIFNCVAMCINADKSYESSRRSVVKVQLMCYCFPWSIPQVEQILQLLITLCLSTP